MTDELIGRLSQIEGVTVVSRTSVARFKETEHRANYHGLGRVQLVLGNYDEALEALEKAHDLRETGVVLVYIGAAQD